VSSDSSPFRPYISWFPCTTENRWRPTDLLVIFFPLCRAADHVSSTLQKKWGALFFPLAVSLGVLLFFAVGYSLFSLFQIQGQPFPPNGLPLSARVFHQVILLLRRRWFFFLLRSFHDSSVPASPFLEPVRLHGFNLFPFFFGFFFFSLATCIPLLHARRVRAILPPLSRNTPLLCTRRTLRVFPRRLILFLPR